MSRKNKNNKKEPLADKVIKINLMIAVIALIKTLIELVIKLIDLLS